MSSASSVKRRCRPGRRNTLPITAFGRGGNDSPGPDRQRSSGWRRHPYAHDPPYLAYSGEGGFEQRTPAEAWLAEHHPALGRFRQMLYERERAVHFRVGTVLLYRHDTWYVYAVLLPPLLLVDWVWPGVAGTAGRR